MRLWSLHPRYLDPQGLVALWRETLLAQAVLHGNTKGYTQHPQLERFKAQAQPLEAIACYLQAIHTEASVRGYRFDAAKILRPPEAPSITVQQGQLDYEWQHLMAKLAQRAPALHSRWHTETSPATHPLFTVCAGGIASWERP